MPFTKVLICNMALTNIGISKTIVDLDTDGSEEARICNLWYEPSLEIITEEHSWEFATSYATGLAAVGSQPANIDWQYAYRAPVDMLRPLRLSSMQGVRKPKPNDGTTAPYRVGSDTLGKLIYTDCEPDDLSLKYLRLFDNPVYFPPSFASSLAWLLAGHIVAPLGRDFGMRTRAMDQYRMELSKARALEAVSSTDDPEQLSEFDRAMTGFTADQFGQPYYG